MNMSVWVRRLVLTGGIVSGAMVAVADTCNWGCSLYDGYRQTTEAGTVWKEFGDGGCYRPNGYILAITGTFDLNDAFGVHDWFEREGGAADCPMNQNPSNATNFWGYRTQLSGVCLTKCYGGSTE